MLIISLQIFKDLFKGNTKAHGESRVLEETDANGKRKTINVTKTEPVTEKLYQDHIKGELGLGIIPINQDGYCKFTAIDIDEYQDKEYLHTILKRIKEYGFPLHPFQSKSGGIHLFTFYAEEIEAQQAIQNAMFMRVILGLPKNTEIFPKQSTLSAGKIGNWINLPYFGDSRKAIDPDTLQPIDFDGAMLVLKESMLTQLEFTYWKDNLPLHDAPPCLQILHMQKAIQNRNNYLFSFACYAKAKFPDNYEDVVFEENAYLEEPLQEKEIRATILNSMAKNTYTYRCNEAPICDFCDKNECGKREYAIGQGVSSLSFEKFVQYDVNPPYYEWTVAGKVMRFYSEQEIIQQDRFRALCLRQLHFVPQKIKQNEWTEIVNTAVRNTIVVAPEADDVVTEIGEVRLMVSGFLKDTKTSAKTLLALGKSWYDQKTGNVYFKSEELIKYLTTKCGKFDRRELLSWLLDKGVKSTRMYVNGSQLRLYCVKMSNFVDLEELDNLNNEVPIVDWNAVLTKDGEEGDV